MPQKIYQAVHYSGVELRWGSGTVDYEPHLHDGYSIGLVTRGHQSMRTGRRSEAVSAGAVLFYEPYQVHENRRVNRNGFSFRNIEVSQSCLRQVMDGFPPPPQPSIFIDARLFLSLMRAFDALVLDEESLAQDELLTGALAELFSPKPELAVPAVAPGLVARARDYLHANYPRPITLDTLAATAQVSRVHLSRVFKRHVGLAPHEYLVQLRVASAKAQLAAGVPVADAAVQSGFADQSHLNRHFKRIVHLTPGAYARSGYKRSRR
ncbi:MAG TPA: AraC family transcriptional regulator [Blastocatellia bacterium]|nr:AraC family transcriptional regulator [Blastocatellia bacterium]